MKTWKGCKRCGTNKKFTFAEWHDCAIQYAEYKVQTSFLPECIAEWWYFRKKPKHLYE